ncbi:MAG TPA: hypothetical protein VF520_11970 [Thermoleophilaceae bacterium]
MRTRLALVALAAAALTAPPVAHAASVTIDGPPTGTKRQRILGPTYHLRATADTSGCGPGLVFVSLQTTFPSGLAVPLTTNLNQSTVDFDYDPDILGVHQWWGRLACPDPAKSGGNIVVESEHRTLEVVESLPANDPPCPSPTCIVTGITNEPDDDAQPQQPQLPVHRFPGHDAGARGNVVVARGANRTANGRVVEIQPEVRDFVGLVSGRLGRDVTIGTGTNHARMTRSGNVSDHWTGWGADLPVRNLRDGDQVAREAARVAGLSEAETNRFVRNGGVVNHVVHGDGADYRVQIIWRTNVGGNHFNHVHVGLRRQLPPRRRALALFAADACGGSVQGLMGGLRTSHASCGLARDVAKAWARQCAQRRDGSCRVKQKLFCRYRDARGEGGTIACSAGRRKVRFETGV